MEEKTREELLKDIVYYCVSMSDIMQAFGGQGEHAMLYNAIVKEYDVDEKLTQDQIDEIRLAIDGVIDGTIPTYSIESLWDELDEPEENE